MALELVCGADFSHNLLCRAGPVDLRGFPGLGGEGGGLRKLGEISPKIFSSNCLQVPSPQPNPDHNCSTAISERVAVSCAPRDTQEYCLRCLNIL